MPASTMIDDITLRSPNSVGISPSVFSLPDSRAQPPDNSYQYGAENNTRLGWWPRTSLDMQDKIS